MKLSLRCLLLVNEFRSPDDENRDVRNAQGFQNEREMIHIIIKSGVGMEKNSL